MTRGAPASAVAEHAAMLAARTLGADRVHAVVLTGSVARGEESVLVEGPKRPVLLGDIEFLVILRDPLRIRQARREMLQLGARMTRECSESAMDVTVEYVPAGLDYLRGLRPSIFAYDLQLHGRVLWGPPDVLQLAPALRASDIPQEDAVRLLLNRLIELVALESADARSLTEHVIGYRVLKTTLDVAGSALAFSGRYASRYSERPLALRRLLEREPRLAEAVGDADALLEQVSRAALCKLRPTADALRQFSGPAAVAQALTWLRGLCRWEMRQWLGGQTNDLADMVARYLAHEPLRTRARGWIKYWWHPLRPPGVTALPRLPRLVWRASPQTLAYAAAVLGHEGRSTGRPELESRAAALLPSWPSGDVVKEAGDLWRWLVRNN